MKIQITARHMRLTKAIRDYVNEKVNKIEHFFDNVVWAQVILEIEKKTYGCEAVVHAGRQTLRASAKSKDLYSAIDLCSAKIDKQVRKLKDKIRSHKGRASAPEVVEAIAPPASPSFTVVKDVPVRPMSRVEAASEMDRMGYNFWLFLDEDTRQLNVIFRRIDNSLGLLQPVKRKA